MTTKRTTLYISEELMKKAKMKALEEDLKANDIYIKAIEKYLSENDNEE